MGKISILLIDPDSSAGSALAGRYPGRCDVYHVQDTLRALEYLYSRTLPHLMFMNLTGMFSEGAHFLKEFGSHPIFSKVPTLIASSDPTHWISAFMIAGQAHKTCDFPEAFKQFEMFLKITK